MKKTLLFILISIIGASYSLDLSALCTYKSYMSEATDSNNATDYENCLRSSYGSGTISLGIGWGPSRAENYSDNSLTAINNISAFASSVSPSSENPNYRELFEESFKKVIQNSYSLRELSTARLSSLSQKISEGKRYQEKIKTLTPYQDYITKQKTPLEKNISEFNQSLELKVRENNIQFPPYMTGVTADIHQRIRQDEYNYELLKWKNVKKEGIPFESLREFSERNNAAYEEMLKEVKAKRFERLGAQASLQAYPYIETSKSFEEKLEQVDLSQSRALSNIKKEIRPQFIETVQILKSITKNIFYDGNLQEGLQIASNLAFGVYQTTWEFCPLSSLIESSIGMRLITGEKLTASQIKIGFAIGALDLFGAGAILKVSGRLLPLTARVLPMEEAKYLIAWTEDVATKITERFVRPDLILTASEHLTRGFHRLEFVVEGELKSADQAVAMLSDAAVNAIAKVKASGANFSSDAMSFIHKKMRSGEQYQTVDAINKTAKDYMILQPRVAKLPTVALNTTVVRGVPETVAQKFGVNKESSFIINVGNIASNHRMSVPGNGAVYSMVVNDVRDLSNMNSGLMKTLHEEMRLRPERGEVAQYFTKEVHLEKVLDLRDERVVKEVLDRELERDILTPENYDLGQIIGDIAHQLGYEGILIPSAQNLNQVNLILLKE